MLMTHELQMRATGSISSYIPEIFRHCSQPHSDNELQLQREMQKYTQSHESRPRVPLNNKIFNDTSNCT